MKSPAVLIVNPVARQASEKMILNASKLLRSASDEITVHLTQKKGDAEELAHKASRNGAALIIAAGGDGTVNEVINGIAHTDTLMAVLPMGTTNVLAKELGIPEDVTAAVKVAITGEAHTLSLGRITVEDPSSPVTRYFCLMAGIGFDGDAVYGFSKSAKGYSGKWAYILSGLKILLKYSPEPLIFSVDGETCTGYSAIIGKASKYGGNFRITPDASLFNPDLYIYIMMGRGRFDILRYVSGIMMKRHLGFSDILYRRASSIKVNGQARIQIDGDYLGKTPATITIATNALRLIF
jgi:YegS/Rv2252/BmrU family lipid kinase